MKNSNTKESRKHYISPKLIEYGSVPEMTRNMQTGSLSDGSGGGGSTKMSTGG